MFATININLLNVIKDSISALLGFLLALILAVTAGILIAIPWLLRVVAMFAWLSAGFIGIQAVRKIYAPFSGSIPVFALQFAVITIMVAWMMAAIMDGKQIWGLLLGGGLVVALISCAATWLFDNWQYGNLFFAALPPTLFFVGMITMSVRLRRRRIANESR